MTNIVKKQVCKCEHCGNEAEMVITCSLPEESHSGKADKNTAPTSSNKDSVKVKGTGTCSHCGNEADIWIDP